MRRNAINGKKLGQYRLALDMRAQDVADVLNRENNWALVGGTISRWERGTRPRKMYRAVVKEYITRLKALTEAKGINMTEAPKRKYRSGWTPEARAKLSQSMKASIARRKAKKGVDTPVYLPLPQEPVKLRVDTDTQILNHLPKLQRRETKRTLFGVTVTEFYT